MTAEPTTPPVNDADLIRYLDGELDDAGRARVESAVAADAERAARLETLRRRGRRLRRMLTKTDVPPPPQPPPAFVEQPTARLKSRRSPSIPLMRAAAVLLVIAGVLTFVPPVRAWIVEQWQRFSTPTESGPLPGEPPLLRIPDTLDIAFPSPQRTFDFELIARQRAGRIRIRVADVDQVTAEMHTRTHTEEFFQFPGGLRVINTEGSVADYEIIVPSTVRAVRVTVAGTQIARYATQAEDGRERVFELGR
jgi:hypothetical protein